MNKVEFVDGKSLDLTTGIIEFWYRKGWRGKWKFILKPTNKLKKKYRKLLNKIDLFIENNKKGVI